jgi:hypothetical protein
MKLLNEVCDAVAARPPYVSPYKASDSLKSYLQILSWKIRSISIPDNAVDRSSNMAKLVGLFQLALLVYLSRTFENILEPAVETQQRIERAFDISFQLSSCDRQFPLLILGCDARTDGERCTVLDLLSRTEKGASSRSFFLTKKLIQAVWI